MKLETWCLSQEKFMSRRRREPFLLNFFDQQLKDLLPTLVELKSKFDKINHPAHYNQGAIQPIDYIEANDLKPVIDSSYPLAELATAFRHQESQRHFGKVCVDIED